MADGHGHGRATAGQRRLAAAVALAGVLLTGCSNDEDGQAPSTAGFTTALAAAHSESSQRAAEIARLSEAAEGQGLERTLEIYAAIADEAQAGRDRYATLHVPAPVAPQMGEVMRLLTDQVEVLDSLAPVAQAGDRERTAEVVRRLAQIGTDLAAARQRLDVALARCGKYCN